MKELFFKFLKFGVVGFSGLVIDFALTWLFKEILKSNRYLANAIGFIAAASSNYILNRIWTFNSHDPEMLIEFSKFFVVSLAGLGINSAILWLFHSRLKYNFYLAKLAAICITILWNFFINYLYTFN